MINWKSIQIKSRTTILLDAVTLRLKKGESLGIIGANGSGKTTLAKAIAGLLPICDDQYQSDTTKIYLSFQSDIQLKHGAKGYRQQRWNSYDTDLVPTVKEAFNKIENQTILHQLIEQFNFNDQTDRFLISLSNGEQRKFEIIKALAQQPDLLIIDNVVNGLDKGSRIVVEEMLNQMISEGHSVVLTGQKPNDFPNLITRFILTKQNHTFPIATRSKLPELYGEKITSHLTIPQWKNTSYQEIIHLNKIFLKIGEKSILKDISWTINSGENWVLSGGNGSGKTSLLNMIFADNPKAFLCDIRLFGKQKGSGESIWEIKERIGFVSPEMHQYLPQGQSVNDVICSGFFDSEGLYEKPSSYEREVATKWLHLIGLEQLNNHPFKTLSASAQRMVLVLRSLVKNPPLLLLDEPFQGLDPNNIQRMKDLLNSITEQSNCSMIFVSHFKDVIPSSFKLELKLNEGKMEYCGIRKTVHN